MNGTLKPVGARRGLAGRRLLGATLGLLALIPTSPPACGGLPLPACVFYGEARDEYGWPYTTNATVILRIQGVACSQWTINRLLAPGVNFRLPLDLDDGKGVAYAAYAARPGQAVTISVLAHGIERTIAQALTPLTGQPGDFLAVYVTSGTDADGDGLPDEWERELMENSGGFFTDISEIRPEDDFDGDGVSNGDEYLAGTYAFLADDYLFIEDTVRLANGRVQLRFLTAPGITYQLLGTSELGPTAAWTALPVALGEATLPQYQAVVGNGFYVSLYLNPTDARRFLRLEAR